MDLTKHEIRLFTRQHFNVISASYASRCDYKCITLSSNLRKQGNANIFFVFRLNAALKKVKGDFQKIDVLLQAVIITVNQ